MKSVLLIDDDDSLSRTLVTSLKARDFSVLRSPTGEIGLLRRGRRDRIPLLDRIAFVTLQNCVTIGRSEGEPNYVVRVLKYAPRS